MKRNALALSLVTAVALATAAPASAQRAPRSPQGSQSGGQAVPRSGGDSSGSSGGSQSGGGRTTSGTSGGTTAGTAGSGNSGSGSGGAARRRGDGTGMTGAPVRSGDSSGGQTGSRNRRDDSPEPGRGRAVARGPADRPTTVIVERPGYWGGFYPWGYGGLGIGGYYGGYYDPWWYDPPYGGYADYRSGYEGSLRLKMKPRDAAVYVDGYYAGIVDDYDGAFQRLEIEPGPHRIEVRGEGYEPLMFEVRIQPDRTTTYKGELKRLP